MEYRQNVYSTGSGSVYQSIVAVQYFSYLLAPKFGDDLTGKWEFSESFDRLAKLLDVS